MSYLAIRDLETLQMHRSIACEQALGSDYTSKEEFARLTWPALEKKIQGCDKC